MNAPPNDPVLLDIIAKWLAETYGDYFTRDVLEKRYRDEFTWAARELLVQLEQSEYIVLTRAPRS